MFQRGITNKAILEALGENGAWHGLWQKITADLDLFIAIRNDAIGVYCRGCLIFGINSSRDSVSFRTHYKYLLNPQAKSPYVDWGPNGDLALNDKRLRNLFTPSADDLDALKKAARAYAEPEKEGVHKLLKANRSSIIDVEIALTGEGTAEEDVADDAAPRRPKADRIDFAALQEVKGKVQLAFFEAKHFSSSELRAQGDKAPPVLAKQIPKYEKLIKNEEQRIKESYQLVCRNLAELRPDCPDAVKFIASGKVDFSISPYVRLVIFGFDEAQRDGGWKKHQKKLEDRRSDEVGEHLGKELVLCVGDPKGFQRGITKVKELI